MTSFKQELDAEVDRLKAEAAKPKKPHRYSTGYRVSDTLRLYCRPSQPKILRLSLSYDLVHQMWLWRDYPNGGAPDKMPRWVLENSVAEFLPFTEGLPGCLMRLEQPLRYYRQHGTRLTQIEKSWNFRTAITARKLGVKNGIESGRIIRTIPWEDQRGYILMLEPRDMLHTPTMTDDEFREFAEAQAAGANKERDQ